MHDSIRIQVHHDWIPQSNPYPPRIEAALDELRSHGLTIRGADKADNPGIIRHETGAEVILLVTALVQLSAAIIQWVRESKAHRPETRISITVNDPRALASVLKALKVQSQP